MTFPTRYTVGWHTWSAGTATTRNITADVWTPALNVAGTSRSVIGWAPTRESEPNSTRVESDLDLFVPSGFTAAPKDVVDVDGTQYEVVAYSMDYNHGPFAWAPGSVIKLKRTEH